VAENINEREGEPFPFIIGPSLRSERPAKGRKYEDDLLSRGREKSEDREE